MMIGQIYRALACIAAMAILLCAVQIIPAPCDDTCSDEAPVCTCADACCLKALALPADHALPVMTVAQQAIRFEFIQHRFVLATDIFRPPIA